MKISKDKIDFISNLKDAGIRLNYGGDFSKPVSYSQNATHFKLTTGMDCEKMKTITKEEFDFVK